MIDEQPLVVPPTSPNAPLISTTEADTVVEKNINTAKMNGQVVQKIVICSVGVIAIIMAVMTLMSLFTSGTKLHGIFFSNQETRTLQFK